MKTILATVLALFLTTSAYAGTVEVSYAVLGTPGDYTLDFTFKNAMLGSVQVPIDWTFYRMGVSLPGDNITASPHHYAPAGTDGIYNAVWQYDNHLNGPLDANLQGNPLFPMSQQSGFLVHSSAMLPPSIASWFMTGSAQADNGAAGFHSGGRYLGMTHATFTGIANGTLQLAPQGLSPVPLPGAVLLFGSGLMALLAWRFRATYRPW